MEVELTVDLIDGYSKGNIVKVIRKESGYILVEAAGRDQIMVGDGDYKIVPMVSASTEERSAIDSLLDGTYKSASAEDIAKKKEAERLAGILEAKRLKEIEAEKIAAIRDSLGEYQVLISDLLGGSKPESGIDHIIDFYDDTHFPEDMRDDIPAPDPDYIWDPEVLEMLYFAHKLNKKCLLTGMPGTGKSTAIKQFAAIMRQPYMRFNGKDGVEPSSFLGYPWASKGGMEWKDGLLPIGVKSGYLVTIDEVFKLPAGINMAMQNLYEQDGSLLLDDKPGALCDKLCLPDADFRLFLTDNVLGTGDNFTKYSATQIQDTSTLDRFAYTKEVYYLPVAKEVKLLQSKMTDKKALKKAEITKLVKFAGLVRNGFKDDSIAVTLSPRGLVSIIELVCEGVPLTTAIQLCFTNKVAEDSEIGACKEFISTCGIV